ncbi:hypothetical protein MBANPS3_008202 [Mucor bainieri]
MSGQDLNDVEKVILASVSIDGSIKGCLMKLAAEGLADSISYDQNCLKPLLSRIVNMSNPTYKKLIEKHISKDILDSFQQVKPPALELDSMMMEFLNLIKTMGDDVDAIMQFVLEQKSKLCPQRKTSNMDACVCCVEHIQAKEAVSTITSASSAACSSIINVQPSSASNDLSRNNAPVNNEQASSTIHNVQASPSSEERLHEMAYKKMSGGDLSMDDKDVLGAVVNDGTVKGCLMKLAAEDLLNDDSDHMCLKLLLSRIVNMSNPTYKKLIQKHISKDILDSFQQVKPPAFELDSMMMEFLNLIKSMGDDVDAIMQLVLEQKSKLYAQRKTSNMYACVCCVEHILDIMDLWDDNSKNSETTYYRRIATLFDYIFMYTDVKLADGETGSEATKSAITFNKIMFGPYDSSSTYPRKIDLLVKCENPVIEICSNEFKRQSVSKAIIVSQQNKNMRINTAILHHNALHGVTDTIYFDVVGHDMYCYYLKWLPNYEVYVGSLVDDVITLPTDPLLLDSLPALIKKLFAFKKFVLDQEKVLKRAIYKKNSRKRAAGVVEQASVNDQHSFAPGYVFFSPKSPATNKKARINDTGESETEDQED